MKNSIIRVLSLVAIFLVTLVILNSCNKESESSITNPNGKIHHNVLKQSTMRFLTCTPIYGGTPPVIIGWTPLECTPPANNCLPTVTITASRSQAFRQAYADFTAQFANNDVTTFFTSGDYLTLFPELWNMSSVVSGLANGDIILHHEIGVDGLEYYIGLNGSTSYLSDWRGKEQCTFVIENKL